ncbi:alkaline phosphatase, partial [Sulfurimonas sp. MAG313]
MKITLLATALCGLLSTSLFGASLPNEQVTSVWYTDAQMSLEEKINRIKKTNKAKNVILFIGDGMGISTITASRILDGQNKGQLGEENVLSFGKFPYSGLVKTYNTNSQTPDSAGTMTAMASGIKTKMGVLGVNEFGARGNCAESKDNDVMTMMELAERNGMSTGVVSTARITHATPAATYAHTPERNWENNSKLTEEAIANGCEDIASQLLSFSYGDGIDVVMGGGRREFMPKESTDVEG